MTALCGKGWANRCAEAVPGTKCRCSCGGANHGSAFGLVAGEQALAAVAKGDRARWRVTGKTARVYVLKDIGSDADLTIAEDAKRIVRQLKPVLTGRRLFFRDRDDRYFQIYHERGAVVRIAPAAFEDIDLEEEQR